MGKKLSSNIDYFEGYQLLGIVSQLRDYSLAFFINKSLDIELKKYEDMDLIDNESDKLGFSWYFYKDEQIQSKIYLISNSSKSRKLFPSKKEMDFFMLIKDYPDEENITNEILPKIRIVQNVLAVFKLQLNEIKNADLFIESIEIHEIKNILRPKKRNKNTLKEITD